MIKANLQLFAAGEMAAAAPAGSATGQDSGQSSQPTQQTGSERPTFQQLIEGEYKQEYEAAVGQRVQKSIQERFRNQRDAQAELREAAPILQELGTRFGLQGNDYRGIYTKLTDDLSQYQKEADEQGTTPEIIRKMHRLEADARRAQEAERASVQGMQIRQHAMRIAKQAEELQQQFPGFDLNAELANPRFVRMTSPGVGLSVKDAFWAIHGAELQKNSMLYAAQQAGQRIAASVQAGASRPAENGMQRSQGPVQVGVDIQHMSKAERAKYRERIKNGETINFYDKV